MTSQAVAGAGLQKTQFSKGHNMWGLWEFIVYGVVPGTSIQITFNDWLIIMLLIGLYATLRFAARTQLSRDIRIAILSIYVTFVIRTQANRLNLAA